MLFSSSVFIFIYLPLVLAIYYGLLRKNLKLKNAFLFLSSLFFYAWGEPKFVLVMMLSIVINWAMGLVVSKYSDVNKSKARLALAFDVLLNLTIIFIYKYLVFTLENIRNLFNITGMKIPEILLPIGISFFTFQAISYVVDVYRGDGAAQKNILNVGLYIALFPQLIAGPIVRYQTIADQINERHENFESFSYGVLRFIVGLSKKVIIANNVAIVADFAFENPGQNSLLLAWLGALAYTFQIYFDFSGYSDMAIGLGKMFGFNFLENFNYPYISTSITEFWRRWHISLSTWFRDYVYIPLGGNRTKTNARHIFNIFVVWLATGVWHGANWTFILWGLMYFVLLIFEKYSGLLKVKEKTRLRVGLCHVYTMCFVIFGWVLFRANNLGDAAVYFKNMLSMSNGLIDDGFRQYFRQYAVYLVMAAIASLPIVPKLKESNRLRHAGSYIAALGLIIMFVISVSFIVKNTYNPFIYFNF